MEANKLLELYNSKFKPALKEGVYKVKMLKHEYVAAKNKAPYIRFTFEVVESEDEVNVGRQITDNRFEKGFAVMISHLRQQLERQDEEIDVQEFLNTLISEQTTFNIWVVKRTVNGTPKTNINFLKPIEEVAPNTEVVDDSQEPANN